MNRHPGGLAQTKQMLERIQLPEGAVCLDLGAGEGDTVRYLRSQGYRASGIDKKPGTQSGDQAVMHGDFLSLPMEDGSVDLCISQCAFFISEDAEGALQEAYRVLKPGGYLLLADLDPGTLEQMAGACGFSVLHTEDLSQLWKQYYIDAIWNDTLRCEEYGCLQERCRGRKLRYITLILRKGEEQHGLI